MFQALTRALGQMFDARILGLIGLCALLSLACFVGAWFMIDGLLSLVFSGGETTSTWLSWAGGLATAIVAWFLFPLVTSAFVGLFLETVARTVEARHYRHLGPAPGLALWTGIVCSLRFLLLVVGANVLLLALAWIFVPAYPIAYFVVNGFLLGREYFELVALRRLDPGSARDLRRRHQGELTATGAALAFLLTLPVVNLVIPIFATAVMVHRFEEWRTRALPGPRQPAGG